MDALSQAGLRWDGIDWLGVTALLMVSLMVLPGALRRNRRTWLPYAAIWLAVIVALAWGYRAFQDRQATPPPAATSAVKDADRRSSS